MSARCTLSASQRSATSSGDAQDGHVEIARQRRERGGALAQESRAPDHDFHAEGLRPSGNLLTDASKPEQAERAAKQPTCLGVRLLVPAAGAQVGHVVGNAPIERHEQAEGQLGHRNGVLPRAIGNVNAAPRRGRDVNRIDAGPRADDQRERVALEHRLGDPRRPDDEHFGVGGLQEGRQRVAVQVGLIHHLATRRLQVVETRRLERIGNEYLHQLPRICCSPSRLTA